MRIARKRFKPQVQKIRFRYNEYIRAPEVRLIDENGDHVGIMTSEAAKQLAEEREMDIVEINPNALPPVVKLTNYGQYKYQKEKEERLLKKNQRETEVKGVRLSLRIGQHDRQLRADQTKKFFEDGNKVKLEIILRGREKAFVPQAVGVMQKFIDELRASAPLKIEQAVAKQANKITALITKA